MQFLRPDRLELKIKALPNGRLRCVYREYIGDKMKEFVNGWDPNVLEVTKAASEQMLGVVKAINPDAKVRFIHDDGGMTGFVIDAGPAVMEILVKAMCTAEIPLLGKGIQDDVNLEDLLGAWGVKDGGSGELKIEEVKDVEKAAESTRKAQKTIFGIDEPPKCPKCGTEMKQHPHGYWCCPKCGEEHPKPTD